MNCNRPPFAAGGNFRFNDRIHALNWWSGPHAGPWPQHGGNPQGTRDARQPDLPRIVMTSPAENDVRFIGGGFELRAEAYAAAGIEEVVFRSGDVEIARFSAPPYEIIWEPTRIADSKLTAEVRDSSGRTQISSAVDVRVISRLTASLLEPDDGVTYFQPVNIPMRVAFEAPDGPLARVSYITGDVAVG